METIQEKMKKFKTSKFYIGSVEQILEKEKLDNDGNVDLKESEKLFKKEVDKIKLLLKKHLELDNVSFLFGTGSSMLLNAVSIRDIPKEIEEKIKSTSDEIYTIFIKLIKIYQSKDNSFLKDLIDDRTTLTSNEWKVLKDEDDIFKWVSKDKNGNIVTPLENFTDFALGLLYISEYSNNIIIDEFEISKDDLNILLGLIKKELFNLCDLKYEKDKLIHHKKFTKALLGRPLNLRRANIFTTNYDLAFEDTFDDLGVHYINGFCGFNNRYFKPEVYDFDMYYPGNTTEGKVRRVEKVLRYYKLHGSLTWVREKQEANNIYGLREFPISVIRNNIESANPENSTGDLIIYPTSYKKGYTLDFPYSELFRQFAVTIRQQQTVLFCIGYSFFDEHINDIIFQALSIPSFSLIIIAKDGDNKELRKLIELNDPRIMIFTGNYLGDFKYFADDLMPNFHDLDIQSKVAESLEKLYKNKYSKDGE